MNAYHRSHRGGKKKKKKDAACKVGVSEAFLAPAGAFQPLLAEGYNTVINTEKREKLTLGRYSAGNNWGDSDVDVIPGTTVSHSAV